jgi:CheY-like chemotaxis protein
MSDMSDAPERPIVLVVDDEPLVRMLAAEILEEAEMEVVEASTAPAALAILERRDDILALFTDIDMPGGMNGLELAGIVHKRWPHIAIVVTSGVTRLGVDELPGAGIFIAKPYASSAPVRVLRHLIKVGPSHH